MLNEANAEEPKLAPPGAGLPWPELLVARLIFGWTRKHTSREQAMENFTRRRNAILQLACGCNAKTGAQRVLIARLRGLEDSSRYWSVFMTLDHLRIVNDSIAGAVTALVSGNVPSRTASTAEVKPTLNADNSVLTAFEQSCTQFEQTVATFPNLTTPTKYPHPWFGPLDAAAWHFMAGVHMNLHLKQIQNILSQLTHPHL